MSPLVFLSQAIKARASAGVYFSTLLAAGFLAFFNGSTTADARDLTELPLEQLMTLEVTTASKFPQTLSEAPAAVTVITAEEIRAYGYRTLADLLRSAPGLYVSDDRNYSFLGARGFSPPGDYNSRILLLLDGYRLNDSIYDGALIGAEFILDVDLIERVEFAPGPGSAIYGGNAFFGVVNVITRHGGALNGTELAAAAASYRSGAIRVSQGRRTDDGLDLLLSASGYASGGQNHYFPEYDDPATNYGVAENLDSDRNRQVFVKVASQHWRFASGYSRRTKEIPTASFFQTFNQPGAYTTDTQYFADLRYENELTPALSLLASAYYGQYVYEGQYMYGLSNQDRSFGNGWGTELRLLQRAFGSHMLLAGGEYRNNLHRDQKNFNADPYASILDDRRSKKAYALYLQDEWTLDAATRINFGARYDGSNEDESAITPRFALIRQWGAATTGKLLYGSAFRPPNVYEKYYVADSGSFTSNPGLGSETIGTLELVLEHYINQDFRIGASLFSSRIHNLITLTSDPASGLLKFQNQGNVSTRGAELRGERVWSGGARLRTSYSYQNAENVGTWLVNSPRHLAKFNVMAPFTPGWHAGFELHYVSERLTPFGNTINDYRVANLTLRADQLVADLDVSASIYNLFDSAYADPPSEEHADDLGRNLTAIAQNGRNYRIKLNYRF